jgi:hypothetical protein
VGLALGTGAFANAPASTKTINSATSKAPVRLVITIEILKIMMKHIYTNIPAESIIRP